MLNWNPSFSRWRHGGWYVNNVIHASGACGCVSNNYPDDKWRIVCDDRRVDLGGPGDFVFKTRDEAARAEYALVEERKATLEPTPRQLADAMTSGCPKADEVQHLYAARDKFVEKLKVTGSVCGPDLLALDRLGRFLVASECWAICTQDVQESLLDDEHHQVRSAATLSNSQLIAA